MTWQMRLVRPITWTLSRISALLLTLDFGPSWAIGVWLMSNTTHLYVWAKLVEEA